MKSVSMLEFRQGADRVLNQVARGQTFVLTYRGKPVARLEPIRESVPDADDPFYRLPELASETGEPLSNDEIDRLVYAS